MNSNKQTRLPVHLLFHVGGVTAAVIGQQKTAITQPVDVYLDVGAIHNDDVRCWGLTSDLQDKEGLNLILKKREKANYCTKKEHTLRQYLTLLYTRSTLTELRRLAAGRTCPLEKKIRVLETKLSERKERIRQPTFPGNAESQTCSS